RAGVEVGELEADEKLFARLDRYAAELGVHLRAAEDRGVDRRLVTQQFLDELLDRRARHQRAASLGVGQQQRAPGEGLRGRLLRGGDQQRRGGDQLLLAEPVTVATCAYKVGEQVIAGVSDPFGHHAADVTVEVLDLGVGRLVRVPGRRRCSGG